MRGMQAGMAGEGGITTPFPSLALPMHSPTTTPIATPGSGRGYGYRKVPGGTLGWPGPGQGAPGMGAAGAGHEGAPRGSPWVLALTLHRQEDGA